MEEMLDTFDINGNFLGARTRSFCHSKEANVYHKPVWIWIVNSHGQVLVQQRASTKKENPNLWDMPVAGHVDAGESLLNACVRETKEELGLDVSQKDFEFLGEYLAAEFWELGQVYLLKLDAKEEEMTLQKEEVSQVKWLDYEDFEKLFYSSEFCDFKKDYRDWICKKIKDQIKIRKKV